MDAEIFLTMEEAKDAVCLDLEHYGIQKETLRAIAELAGGGWPDRFDEVMGAEEDRTYDTLALVREFMNSPTTTEALFFKALSLLFWADVRKALGPDGEKGVRVATDLGDFACLQCGQCCTNLDYSRALTAEDIAMWRAAGRKDILARVGKDPDDGGYLIWVDPLTGKLEETCPFLSFEHGKSVCTIHEIKPAICREYPATKKHGFMTDCLGVQLMFEKERAARG